MSLRSLAILFVLLFWVGCAFKLESHPTVKVLQDQPGGQTKTSEAMGLLQQSKREAAANTKDAIINVRLSERVKNSLAVDPDRTCVQAVKLRTADLVVVDFSSEPCPAIGELVSPLSIEFTVSFKQLDPSSVELILEGKTLGTITASQVPPDAVLNDICTADFAGRCKVFVQDSQFLDISLQ